MKTLITTILLILVLTTSALADEIKIRAVSFENEGEPISGTLYLPNNYKSGQRLPMVIITGAWTSVEEQMPKDYALEMVERGFAAFTFDFRGWGKSGSLPDNIRYKEDPAAKTSDIRAAFKYVASLPEVDTNNINGLGICASAGYMIDAVSGNPLVNSIGLVAPWLQNREIVEVVYGGEEGIDNLIQVSRSAERAETEQIIPAAGPEGAEGVLMPIGGYYFDKNRGAIPEYDNKWNQASWEGWLNYHPADNPSRLDKPITIVHSEAAAIPQGVKTFTSGLVGDATTKWLEDVTQFDFYDNPEDVEKAADIIAAHFRNHSMK